MRQLDQGYVTLPATRRMSMTTDIPVRQ